MDPMDFDDLTGNLAGESADDTLAGGEQSDAGRLFPEPSQKAYDLLDASRDDPTIREQFDSMFGAGKAEAYLSRGDTPLETQVKESGIADRLGEAHALNDAQAALDERDEKSVSIFEQAWGYLERNHARANEMLPEYAQTPDGPVFQDMGKLDAEGQAAWIAGERSDAEQWESYYRGWYDRLAGRELDGDDTMVSRWAMGHATAGIERQRQRLKMVEEMERGEREAAKYNATRARVDDVLRGTADLFGAMLKGAGYAGEFVQKYGYDPLSPDYARSDAKLSKVEENLLWKAGQYIEVQAKRMFPKDEARAEEFGTALAEGAGSMVAFFGPSIAIKVLTKAGPLTLTAISGLSGALSMSDLPEQTRAKLERDAALGEISRDDPDYEDKITGAWLTSLVIGASEAAPLAGLFAGRANGTVMRNILAQAAEEGGQEWIQTVLENLAAQHYYDPERRWDDGAWQGTVIGGILGAKIQTGVELYRRGVPLVIDSNVTPDESDVGEGFATDRETVDPDAPVPDLSEGVRPGHKRGRDDEEEAAPDLEPMARRTDQAAGEAPNKKIVTKSQKDAARQAYIEHFGEEPIAGLRTNDIRRLISEDQRRQAAETETESTIPPPPEPIETVEEPADTAAPAPTDDLRADLEDLIASKSGQSGWQSALGADDATYGALIEEAIEARLLRRDKRGRISRVPLAQRPSNASLPRTGAQSEAIPPPPEVDDGLVEDDRIPDVPPTPEVRADVPTFDDIRDVLPLDAAGEPDIKALAREARERYDSTWADLSDEDKVNLYRVFEQMEDAEYADPGALEDDAGDVPQGELAGGVRPDEEGGDAGGPLDGSGERSGGALGLDDGGVEDVAGDADGVAAEGGEVSGDTGDRAGDRARGGDTPAAPVISADELAALEAQIAEDAERIEREREERLAANYQITDADEIGKGGPKAKVRANIAAIRVLRTLEAEEREATEAEKKILAKYTGWGAFSQAVFDSNPYSRNAQTWAKERAQLADLLEPEEYKSARFSTLNAHYTSPEVIKGMWQTLERLGFKGGRAIEPAAGIGHFIGMTPEHLRESTDWTAVELDTISGKITRALYGAADVRINGFEKESWPDNFFDLAVSNVPFGGDELRVRDKRYKHNHLIHDYFFIKALDKVRPGGIVAFITSKGTLDKARDFARNEIKNRATFLGAIRLPGGSKGAFASNAGTDVTTDIIFLRKRLAGEVEGDTSWLNLETIKTPDGETDINAYFAQNPQMMLGKMRLTGSMYGAKEPVLIGPSNNLDERIVEAAENLPADAMIPSGMMHVPQPQDIDTNTDGIRESSFYEKDGQIYRKIEGVGVPQKLNAQGEERVRLYMGMRDLVNAMLARQTTGDATDMDAMRGLLHQAYDAFVERFGPINKTVVTVSKRTDKLGNPIVSRRFPNFSPIEDDPDAYKVAALEIYDEKTDTAIKTAIFENDILGSYQRPEITSAADALAVSLNETNSVDMPRIAEILGVSEPQAAAILGDTVYLNPNGRRHETATAYLSGDVVTKLEEAREAAMADPQFERNVTALEAAQPRPVTRHDPIIVNLGTQWVPDNVYQQFFEEVLGSPGVVVKRNAVTRRVTIEGRYGRVSQFSGKALAEYQTDRVSIEDIVQAALNNRTVEVWDRVDRYTRVRNPAAEEVAAAKIKQLRDVFSGNEDEGIEAWVWKDEARAQRLEAAYNREYNRIVPQRFDGSHLVFPGLTKLVTFPDGTTGEIYLTPARVNAIWRILQNGNALLAHAVGAGKAQPLDAKVLTPNGWKRMGDISVGDQVIAADGQPTTVLGVYPQGEKEIFKVVFSDGSETECCDEHLWLTQTYRERMASQRAAKTSRHWPSGDAKVRTLAEIRGSLVAPHLGAKNHSVPIVEPVRFNAQTVPLDPYLVGVLIGDGSLRGKEIAFSTADAEIVESVSRALPEACEVRHRSNYDYAICFAGEVSYAKREVATAGFRGTAYQAVRSHPVGVALDQLGLRGKYAHEKRVPDVYLKNSIEVREAILQGLMDTDGTVNAKGTHVSFSTSSPGLADDVAFLVRSLGGVVRRTLKRIAGHRNATILTVTLPSSVSPFRLARKASRVRPKTHYAPVRYIVDVVPAGRKEAQCIAVANPAHLYVTDDFIVTHNTWTSIMAGMEMKRLGQIQRPMYVVPNHMLNQFTTEFYQAYPNARLLVATKDKMSKANRKAFAARVAAEQWDGIIITHSAFSRIRMDDASYEKFFDAQIAEMQAAKAGADSSTVKDIEKFIKALETRMEKMLNVERKDEGMTFAEMGVDYLFVDEAHLFKNLDFATQHTRVKGVATRGSQRSFDMLVKLSAMRERNPKRFATFMTATPMSRSMAEWYTIMRYIMPDVLEQYGITNFDDWARLFGEIQTKTEMAPNGRDYVSTSSFSRFINVPELHAMISGTVDFQTAETLGLKRPALKNGKPTVVEADLSEAEDEAIDALIREMDALKHKKGPPKKGEENHLSLFTKMLQNATDGRLVDPSLPFNPEGKIAKAIDNIYQVWEAGNADPEAPDKGQVVFLDMGVPNSKSRPKAKKAADSRSDEALSDEELMARVRSQMAGDEDVDDGAVEGARVEAMLEGKFNLYEDIRERLVARGIPKEQIVFIHEAKSDDDKAKIFAKVREGQIRVLIGTRAKMGVGTNIQKRLKALHHIDAPWNPADLEQADGRIIRQGNKNAEVEIFRYVTRRSPEAYRWQLLERKAESIAGFMAGARGMRVAEEIDSPLPDAAEIKAAASGDPRILREAELKKELNRLQVQHAAHFRSIGDAQNQIAAETTRLERLRQFVASYQADAANVKDLSGDKFEIEVRRNGKTRTFTERKKAGEDIKRYLLDLVENYRWGKITGDIGVMSGFAVEVEAKKTQEGIVVKPKASGQASYEAAEFMVTGETDPVALVRRFERLVASIATHADQVEQRMRGVEQEVERLTESAKSRPFPKQDRLDAAKEELEDLQRDMRGEGKEKVPGSPENLAAREEAARERMAQEDYAGATTSMGRNTSEVEGFWSDDWKAARRYQARNADGSIRDLGFDEAIDYLYDEAVAKAEAAGGAARNRKGYVVIGFGGAGKSTVANPLGSQMQAVHASADDAKLIIPEFDGGRNSSGVQEESRRLGKEVYERLLANGHNLIVEKIGVPTAAIDALIERMQVDGYDVTLLHVDVPVAVAMERAIKRFEATGRAIPARMYGVDIAGTYEALKGKVEHATFEWKEPSGWQWSDTNAPGLEGFAVEDQIGGNTIAYPGVGGAGNDALGGSGGVADLSGVEDRPPESGDGADGSDGLEGPSAPQILRDVPEPIAALGDDPALRGVAMDALKNGRRVKISERNRATMRRLIAGLPHHILPEGVDTTFLIEAKRNKDGTVTARYEGRNGSIVEQVIPFDAFINARAFAGKTAGGRDFVAFNRFGVPADGRKTLRRELWHEGVHLLRSRNQMPRQDFERLLRHAIDLRVLDVRMADYLRAVGDPLYQTASQTATIGQKYSELYAGPAKRQAASEASRREGITADDWLNEYLSQEAVTHMVELYLAGNIDIPLPEDVREILHRIETGETAGRPRTRDVDMGLQQAFGADFFRAARDVLAPGEPEPRRGNISEDEREEIHRGIEERILADLPVSPAEKRRLEKRRQAMLGKMSGPMYAITGMTTGQRTNANGWVLRLPFAETWGDPRFDEDDRKRALARLDEIAKMPAKASWEDTVAADRDIKQITSQLFYTDPTLEEDQFENTIGVESFLYVEAAHAEADGATEPDQVLRAQGSSFFYRGSDGNPDLPEDVLDFAKAGKAAIDRLIQINQKSKRIFDLLKYDRADPPKGRRSRTDPSRTSERMRSGFYFQAGRKIDEVPDRTFEQGGQAVINWLRKEGVSVAEVEHFQLQEMFGDTQTEQSRPATREAFKRQIARRMFDFKRKTLWWNPEMPTGDYDAGGTRAFDGPRIPGRGVYFERLMAFPLHLRSGEDMPAGSFSSPHWYSEMESTFASWRGSVRELPGLGKTVLGEEGQSDMMQGANTGRRPRLSKEDLAKYKTVEDRLPYLTRAARQHQQALADNASIFNESGQAAITTLGEHLRRGAELPEWRKTVTQLREAMPDGQAIYDTAELVKHLDDLQALVEGEPFVFSPKAMLAWENVYTPETPIDDVYPRTMIRDLLLLASVENADAVAIATSETTERIQATGRAAHFYDGALKGALQRELRRLTGDDKLEVTKTELPKPLGAKRMKAYSVWAAPLSPEVVARIRTEGLPMLAYGADVYELEKVRIGRKSSTTGARPFEFKILVGGEDSGLVLNGMAKDDTALVEWIGPATGMPRNKATEFVLGIRALRQLREAIRPHFPEVTRFTGLRISGARTSGAAQSGVDQMQTIRMYAWGGIRNEDLDRVIVSEPSIGKTDEERRADAEMLGFDFDTEYYHGTGAFFDAFSRAALGANFNYGGTSQGFFFTTKKALAEQYVKRGGRLINARLRMLNPYVFNADEALRREVDALASQGKPIEAKLREIVFAVSDKFALFEPEFERIAANAYRNGHDAVIFDFGPRSRVGRVVIVPRPEQIRDYRAAFDRDQAASANLMYASGADVDLLSQAVGTAFPRLSAVDVAVRTGHFTPMIDGGEASLEAVARAAGVDEAEARVVWRTYQRLQAQEQRVANGERDTFAPETVAGKAIARHFRATPIEAIGADAEHPGRVLAYHGTMVDFDRMDIRYAADLGFHFGTPQQANARVGLADEQVTSPNAAYSEGARVLPAILDLDSVLTLPDLALWTPGTAASAIEAAEPRAQGLSDRMQAAAGAVDGPLDERMQAAYAVIRETLTDLGFDGIRYRNEVEGGGWSYVVWQAGHVTSPMDTREVASLLERELADLRDRYFALDAEYARIESTPEGVDEEADAAAGDALVKLHSDMKTITRLANRKLRSLSDAEFDRLFNAGLTPEMWDPKDSQAAASPMLIDGQPVDNDRMAETLPGAMLFAFAGVEAATADRQALARALEMKAAGEDRDAIWSQTGWFEHMGTWWFEIDDSRASLLSEAEAQTMLDDLRQQRKDINNRVKEWLAKEKVEPDLFPGLAKKARGEMRRAAKALAAKADENYGLTWLSVVGRRAEYVMKHPDLYEAFPSLMRTLIFQRDVSGPEGVYGSYSTERIKLYNYVERQGAQETRSTAAHEVQHALQDRMGINLQKPAYEAAEKMRERLGREIYMAVHDALVKQDGTVNDVDWPHGITPDVAKTAGFWGIPKDSVLRPWDDLTNKEKINWLGVADFIIYRRMAYEVQARTVQKRLDMTSAERRARPPWLDYDVPEGDQVTLYDPQSVPSKIGRNMLPAAQRDALESFMAKQDVMAMAAVPDLLFATTGRDTLSPEPQRASLLGRLINALGGTRGNARGVLREPNAPGAQEDARRGLSPADGGPDRGSGQDRSASPGDVQDRIGIGGGARSRRVDSWADQLRRLDFASPEIKEQARAAGWNVDSPVYSGSPNAGFDAFDPLRFDPIALRGPGVYMTEDLHVAGGKPGDPNYTPFGYTSRDAEGKTFDKAKSPGIYKLIHRITQPFDTDTQKIQGSWLPPEYQGVAAGEHDYDDLVELLARYNGDRADAPTPQQIVKKALQGQGFDGITHMGGGRYTHTASARHRVWVAFSARQVRSITAEFATEGPNLMYAIGGEFAETADLDALALAKRLEAGGPLRVIDSDREGYEAYDRHRTDIWQETGWMLGADGKWRFEISDHNLVVRDGPSTSRGLADPDGPVYHPDFAAAYPGRSAAANLTVEAPSANGRAGGIYVGRVRGGARDYAQLSPILPELARNYLRTGMRSLERRAPVQSDIRVRPGSVDGEAFDARSVMGHELTHLGSDVEGFARGGMPSLFSDAMVVAEMDRMRQAGDSAPSARVAADNLYRRLLNEIEARAAQKRLDMTPEERRARPLWRDFDVPEHQAILVDANEVVSEARMIGREDAGGVMSPGQMAGEFVAAANKHLADTFDWSANARGLADFDEALVDADLAQRDGQGYWLNSAVLDEAVPSEAVYRDRRGESYVDFSDLPSELKDRLAPSGLPSWVLESDLKVVLSDYDPDASSEAIGTLEWKSDEAERRYKSEQLAQVEARTVEDVFYLPNPNARAAAFKTWLDANKINYWTDGYLHVASAYFYVEMPEGYGDETIKVRFADHWRQSANHLEADFNVVSDAEGDRSSGADAFREAIEEITKAWSGPPGSLSLDRMYAWGGADLDMSPEARKALAEAMGFDTSRVWYHVTMNDFDAFRRKYLGENTDSGEWAQKLARLGYWFSDDPEAVARGASMDTDGGRTIPVYVKGEVYEGGDPDISYGMMTLSDLANTIDHFGGAAETIKEFNRRGYKAIAVADEEFGVTSLVVFGNKNIRSVNAAFDPAQSDSPNLMYAWGGFADSRKSENTGSIDRLIQTFRRAIGMTATPGLRGFEYRRETGETYRINPSNDPQGRGGWFGRTWIGRKGLQILSQYDRYAGIARMRSTRALAENIHEGAHHLTRVIGADLLDAINDHSAELMTFSVPGTMGTAREAFAEWFRVYITNPQTAEAGAPNFHQAFEDIVDAEMQALGDLRDIQEAYAEYDQQSPLAQMARDQVPGGKLDLIGRIDRSIRTGRLESDISLAISNTYTAIMRSSNPIHHIVRRLLEVDDAAKVRQGRLDERIDLSVYEGPQERFQMLAGSYKRGHNWLTEGITDRETGRTVARPLRDAIAMMMPEAKSGASLGAALGGVAGLMAGPMGGLTTAIVGSIVGSAVADYFLNRNLWNEEAYNDLNAYLEAVAKLGRYDQLEQKQAELRQLTADLDAAKASRTLARMDLDQARTQVRTLEDRETRMTALRNRQSRALGAASTKLAKLQAEIGRLNAAVAQAQQDIDDGSDQARVELRRARRSLSLRNRQSQEQTREVSALQDEVDTYETGILLTQAALLQARQARDLATMQLSAADQDVGTARTALQDRKARGASRPPGVESRDKLEKAVAEAEAKHPKIKDAARIVHEFLDGLLYTEWKAGRWTDEEYNNLLASGAWYVPLMRDVSDIPEARDASRVASARFRALHRFGGSDRAVFRPLDMVIERSYGTSRAIAHNDFVMTLANVVRRVLESGGGGAEIAEEVRPEEVMDINPESLARIRATLEGLGMDPQEADRVSQIFEHDTSVTAIKTPTGKVAAPGVLIPFYENGERKMLKINDPDWAGGVYDAINALGTELGDIYMRWISMGMRVFTSGVTLAPAFAVINAMRDSLQAFVYEGVLPIITQLRGIEMELSTWPGWTSPAGQRLLPQWMKARIAENERLVRAYHDAGGIRGGQFTAMMDQTRDKGDWRGVRNRGFFVRASRFWEAVELAETSTRLGTFSKIYNRLRKRNPNMTEEEAFITAAQRARDLMDFDSRGSRMQIATRLAAFLNPALRDLDKQYREFTAETYRGSAVFKATSQALRTALKMDAGIPLTEGERQRAGEAAKVFARFAGVNMMIVALALLYWDDEEIQEYDDRKRTAYIPLRVNGEIYQLPLPFSHAAPAVSTIEFMRSLGKDDPAWKERVLKSLYDNYAPPIQTPPLTVSYELWANYSIWAQREIVPDRPFGGDNPIELPPEMQHDEWTHTLSIKIGQAIGVSPMKVEHLIKGLAATLGRQGLEAAEYFLPGGQPKPGEDVDPIARRLMHNPYRGTNAMQELYGQMRPVKGGGVADVVRNMILGTAKTYQQSDAGYRAMLRGENLLKAQAWAEKELPPEYRAYAYLMGHFGEEAPKEADVVNERGGDSVGQRYVDAGRSFAERRMAKAYEAIHPLNRLDAVVSKINGVKIQVMKDVVNAGKWSRPEMLKVDPKQGEMLIQTLNQLAVAEARNTWVAMGHGVWKGEKTLPTDDILDIVKSISEPVYDLLTERIEKAGVGSIDSTVKAWGLAQKELLERRHEADLGDAIAALDQFTPIGSRERKAVVVPDELSTSITQGEGTRLDRLIDSAFAD